MARSKQWIVVPCLSMRLADMDHTHCAVVKADTAEEAGQAAREMIEGEDSELDPGYMDVMFALEFDPENVVALNVGTHYTRSEQQCCGDGAGRFTGDGHAGMCPRNQDG